VSLVHPNAVAYIAELEREIAAKDAEIARLRDDARENGELMTLWVKANAELKRKAAESRVAELERELATEKNTWRCFECGFETADRDEALAHFGDRDDAEEFKPLCKWWARMTPEERGEALQDTIHDLNDERDENAALMSRIEGLEHRLQEFEHVIDARFPGCRSINDIFHRYDTTEGLKLVAEAEISSEKQAREAAERELQGARRDTERLDWCTSHGAAPTKCSDGTWDVLLGDEYANYFVSGHGETPRAALDAARSASPCSKEKS
jgi:hypothetical protein